MSNLSKTELLKNLYKDTAENYLDFPLAEEPEDIIPGEGPVDAQIFFIGEAPGAKETEERRPFVGRSGKLFRKILEEETDILESEIYISNIVKVRPPDNRDPDIEEIAAFKEILDQEIDIIKPKLVVTLGRFSMTKFLNDVTISQVHGKLHKVKWPIETSLGYLDSDKTDENTHKQWDLFILPMYHPAAGLRNGKVKAAFIEDLKKIPKIIKWIEDQREVNDLKLEVVEHLF